MCGGEGVNLGSGSEASGGIFNSIPPYRLCRPENVVPEEVAVFPVSNPWC